MRKIFIYIHLVFAILSFLGEAFMNFRDTRKFIYSTTNFRAYFVKEKLYHLADYSATRSLGGSTRAIDGFLKKDRKKRTIIIADDRVSDFLLKNENEEWYVNVWYCPKLDVVSVRYNDTEKKYYNGLWSFLFFWIWIIPEIWYLIILRKREKRALLENKPI